MISSSLATSLRAFRLLSFERDCCECDDLLRFHCVVFASQLLGSVHGCLRHRVHIFDALIVDVAQDFPLAFRFARLADVRAKAVSFGTSLDF